MENDYAHLTCVRKKLSELNPHPKNPRKHPNPGSPEWNALKASLAHDYFDPLVWNKRNGLLVSGHLRLKILLESGFNAADVIVVDYDEKTHLSRMVAANRLIGEDDKALLQELLKQLDGSYGLLGTTDAEIEALLPKEEPEAAPARVDKAEALLKKWNVKAGQVWAAGPHRLGCGDSTVAATVADVMGGG